MSELVIFIIGAIVFAITVYGAVMAGGLAMSRIQVEEDPRLRRVVDGEELEKLLPSKLKY